MHSMVNKDMEMWNMEKSGIMLCYVWQWYLNNRQNMLLRMVTIFYVNSWFLYSRRKALLRNNKIDKSNFSEKKDWNERFSLRCSELLSECGEALLPLQQMLHKFYLIISQLWLLLTYFLLNCFLFKSPTQSNFIPSEWKFLWVSQL